MRKSVYKLKPPAVEIIDPGALDATSQILGLKRSKADYVILHLGIGPSAAVIRSAMKFKFTPPFFGTFYSCDEDIIKLGGKAAERYAGIHSFNPWYHDSPGMDHMRKVALRYTPGKSRNRVFIQGWVSSMIMAEGMKRASKSLNNESLIDAIEGIKNFYTGDICAPITFGPNNHKASEYCRIYKADIKNIKFTPLTGWIKP